LSMGRGGKQKDVMYAPRPKVWVSERRSELRNPGTFDPKPVRVFSILNIVLT
jgi:hypothetical protein